MGNPYKYGRQEQVPLGNLGEVFKYERGPVDTVDRLEDRIAEQERRLYTASYDRPVDNRDTSYEELSASITQPKESSMPEVKAKVVKALVAKDYQKYIGEIVNNTYDNTYVEIVGIVGEFVAIKNRPTDSAPELVGVSQLALFD
jgi:hypothetical protein